MGKTAANPVSSTLSFRVTQDEKDTIGVLARRHQVSVSRYLRDNLNTILGTELLAFLFDHDSALTTGATDDDNCREVIRHRSIANED